MGSLNLVAWTNSCRDDVIRYLDGRNIAYRQVSEFPEMEIYPHSSLWGVELPDRPGWVGLWVAAGDHPPEGVSGETFHQPAAAFLAIARQLCPQDAQFSHVHAEDDDDRDLCLSTIPKHRKRQEIGMIILEWVHQHTYCLRSNRHP